MKLIMKTLIAGLVMSAGIAYAEVEATDPVVIARQDPIRAKKPSQRSGQIGKTS